MWQNGNNCFISLEEICMFIILYLEIFFVCLEIFKIKVGIEFLKLLWK